MRRDIVADQAAQEQTALYEQFLDALHGTVLALKASGTEVTPKLVNRAISEFNKRAVQLQRWLEDYSHDIVGDYVVNGLPDDIYEAWLGEPERDFWFNFSRCLSSNRSAFVSAIRFGSAFNGLSDLLDNMHGAVGYLVQKKSQEMKWNVRLEDGRTVNCLKLFYTLCKFRAYRAHMIHDLMDAKSRNLKVNVEDEEGNIVDSGEAEKFLTDSRLIDTLFHINSKNRFVYVVQS